MSSQHECLSQRTAFHTAGSHKPIEVKQQSLARVAQIMGAVNEEKENDNRLENDDDFEGDEIDDDLVFSTVPQRSFCPPTKQIHFDEIDDDEMRRFAESFEQEQQEIKDDENDSLDMDDDHPSNIRTPIKSSQFDNNKPKEISIGDIDALLNENDDDNGNNDDYHENQMEQQEQMSPIFKKKL